MCGFPQTVHGGLTAALVDETVGGLAVALWRSGALGFRPPAYTARLEVDYKKVRGASGNLPEVCDQRKRKAGSEAITSLSESVLVPRVASCWVR